MTAADGGPINGHLSAWSGGRVVMQRTANPRMWVRFPPGPPAFSMRWCAARWCAAAAGCGRHSPPCMAARPAWSGSHPRFRRLRAECALFLEPDLLLEIAGEAGKPHENWLLGGDRRDAPTIFELLSKLFYTGFHSAVSPTGAFIPAFFFLARSERPASGFMAQSPECDDASGYRPHPGPLAAVRGRICQPVWSMAASGAAPCGGGPRRCH